LGKGQNSKLLAPNTMGHHQSPPWRRRWMPNLKILSGRVNLDITSLVVLMVKVSERQILGYSEAKFTFHIISNHPIESWWAPSLKTLSSLL